MSAAERRVLIVSFFYPPDPAVGGRRVAKFAGYLPEFGWSAQVLTADTRPDAEGGAVDADPSVHATDHLSPWKWLRSRRRGEEGHVALRERMTARGPVARALYSALRHVLPMSPVRMPDATLGWVPWAVREGERLLRDGGFSAILSSAGPPSSHIVASRLQRRSGLPWLADYRDLWTGNHWEYRIPPFHWLERHLERRVVRPAAVVTSTSPTWAGRLAALHDKRAEVVYNGFDPDDYPDTAQRAERFTLLYVGTLTWPDQALEPLFAAVRHLVEDDAIEATGFNIQFLGTDPGVVEMLAARHAVDRYVRLHPSVDYRQSLARQREATALLFLGWRDPQVGFISAKLFEYLGARRPILSVGPPGGDVDRILAECQQPAPTDDPHRIAALLRDWLHRFHDTGALTAAPPPQAAYRYTRRAQTGRLAEILQQISR